MAAEEITARGVSALLLRSGFTPARTVRRDGYLVWAEAGAVRVCHYHDWTDCNRAAGECRATALAGYAAALEAAGVAVEHHEGPAGSWLTAGMRSEMAAAKEGQ
jgi:hypothetical protein